MLKEKIIQDRLHYLKNGDSKANTILSTVLGELDRLNTKEPSDEQVIKVIRKMIESNNLVNDETAIYENTILQPYLPALWDEFRLACKINDIATLNGYTIKDMGKIMKELSELIPGQYDGKLASETIKKLLG